MNRATCPDVRHLQMLLEGGDGDEAKELAHHLESCDDCQQTLELLAAEPPVWQDTQRLGESRLAEPALQHMVEQLKNQDPLSSDDLDLSFMSAADHPELLGILGSYEVQQEIGRGGMGIVLKARDPALNRTVAIKVLSPSLASSAKARQRFLREGRAAAAVAHENIVPVYGVSEAACVPYLVMQYVAGESLQDRLDRGEPLELADIVRIGLQTASGLAAAHAKGLIHRDIKPANLLMENGGARVMITDFGLARTVHDVQVTQAGVVTGTPEFMAPEQARGEPIDHRADLFSLGSVLYALCTGVPPFRGSTTLGVLRQVSDETPKAVRSLNPRAPLWLEKFIARLMQKKPADRIQSAAEAAALLDGYLGHLRQPTTVAPPALPPSRLDDGPTRARWARVRQACHRHPRVAALGVVAGLILAVCVVRWFGFFQAQLPPEPNAFAAKFYQDFRGSRTPPACARLMGLDAGAVARPEEDGFRITLPSKQEPRIRVGLELLPTVKGNFEITAGYEIISLDRPTTGEGVGAELYIGTAPMLDGLGVLRLARVTEGEVYMISRSSNQDGKLKFKQHFVPTVATSGRLRLTRHGAEVTAWAAEGPADEFRELCRYDLGPEDVSVIWLTAFAGGSQHGVDLRIVDLNIVADSVAADSVPPPSDPGVAPAGSRGWAAAYVLIGLIVTMACLGLWRYLRRAGAVGAMAVGPAPPAAELLSIACPGCAKALRVKAALAEKNVRCPHCGQMFRAPVAKVKNSEAKKRGRSARAWLAAGGILAAGVLIVAVLVWFESPPTKSFVNTLLGPEAIPDVRETGFYFPEQLEGRAFRWTNGNARLTIPIDPKNLPEALAIDLFAFRPKRINQVQLQITANGQDLFHDVISVPPWSWQKTLDLRGVDLGKELALDIISDSFVPSDGAPTVDDSRTLGVQVRSIKLLRNERQPAEADQ